MHNNFFYILIFVSLIKIYIHSIVGIRIDQTIYLVNENMIADCVSQKSILEAYEQGYGALELDKNKLEKMVNNTIKDNLPFCKCDIYYYYYDSVSMKACNIDQVKCNSVQIKIDIRYSEITSSRELRYELVSN